MTSTESGGFQTDEQFLHTVKSQNVIEADEALWAAFESFLGIDPVGAWRLIEVTHQPMKVVDAEGNPTDDWELVSSGTWKRDQDVPTPDRVIAIAVELDTPDEETPE